MAEFKRVEKVKVVSGANEDELAEEYTEWYRSVLQDRASIAMLKEQPLIIKDRLFSHIPKGKGVRLSIAVFYEDFEVPETAKGTDRGGAVDKRGGVSAVGRRM